MRAVSKKRAKDAPVRAAAEIALGWDNGVGTCARCGLWGYVNGHERLSRAQGGDPTNPDCLLCPECNTYCEDFPPAAAYNGWKVSKKHPHSKYLADNEARCTDGSTHTFVVPS